MIIDSGGSTGPTKTAPSVRLPLVYLRWLRSALGREEPLADGTDSSRPVAACRHSQDLTVKLQEADVRRTTKLAALRAVAPSAPAGLPCGREIAARRLEPGAIVQQ